MKGVVTTNKEKRTTKTGAPGSALRPYSKRRVRVKTNKEKRTTKAVTPGSVLRLYSKRKLELKHTRKRGRRRHGPLGVS